MKWALQNRTPSKKHEVVRLKYIVDSTDIGILCHLFVVITSLITKTLGAYYKMATLSEYYVEKTFYHNEDNITPEENVESVMGIGYDDAPIPGLLFGDDRGNLFFCASAGESADSDGNQVEYIDGQLDVVDTDAVNDTALFEDMLEEMPAMKRSTLDCEEWCSTRMQRSGISALKIQLVRLTWNRNGSLGLFFLFLRRWLFAAFRKLTNREHTRRGRKPLTPEKTLAYLVLKVATSLKILNGIKKYWCSKMFMWKDDILSAMSCREFCAFRTSLHIFLVHDH